MKQNRKELDSVADVIDALGRELPGSGRNVDIACFLDVTPARISQMLSDDRFPPQRHLVLVRFLEARGYRINEEKVFGYSARSLLEKAQKCNVEFVEFEDSNCAA